MKLPFQPDFRDKVAVVTGGSGVLGAVFVRAVGMCGAKVAVLVDRNLTGAQLVADEINAGGGTAIAVTANVLEKESMEAAHKEVLEKLGPCDILINGAGGNNPRATTDDEFYSKEIDLDPAKKSFFDLEPDAFHFVFGLNLMGTLLPTQVFARDMVERPGSVILNISSMNSFAPLTKIPAYSAAKAAVSNFTKWLAVYFAKSGVRVNAIAPGFFSTAQNAALLFNPDGTPAARTAKILGGTPMGRFGEPEDLVGTLLWLLDNASSGFVTGVVVPVDGGFSAYGGV